MKNRDEIKDRIYEIEDKIRRAPEDTPPRQIYEWYAETDSLRDELNGLAGPDESNLYSVSNADMEDIATEEARDNFVDQWNEDSEEPQTYSQIVGTAR